MTRIAFILVCLFLGYPALGWDGVTDDGHVIEVESYDHQGQGEGDVEYFDYTEGSYKSGYMDMEPGGTGVIIDDESGEEVGVDMD
jgi:hypothetical protein